LQDRKIYGRFDFLDGGRPIKSSAERLTRFPILGVVMTAQPAGFVTRASSRSKSYGFSRCSVVSTEMTRRKIVVEAKASAEIGYNGL
jgi:hypothetical protein